MRNGKNVLALATLLLAPTGCDTLTGPDTLGEFSWAEIEGEPVEESSNFVAVGSDVLVIGELTTPTACYRLAPHLTEGGSRITLRIAASNAQTPNCAQRIGSYRYEATLHRLTSDTHELVIVHDVEDGQRTEFKHALAIRG